MPPIVKEKDRLIRLPTSALALFSILLLSTGCASTARDFIADKTHLQLTSDVLICSQSVYNSGSCEPGGTGGAPWAKNKNFDVYGISDAAARAGYQAALAEIRMRYLGTPYYRGSLHVECKSGLAAGDLPAEEPLSDDIDLTSTLQTKVVDEVAANAIFKLNAKGANISASVQDAFKSELKRTVDEKARVRYIWFLVKWTGGHTSVAGTSALKKCVDEVDAVNNQKPGGATLVTGVAGLLILTNNIDTTVTSDSTVTNALSVALNGAVPSQVADMQAQIASDWKHAVDKVFTVNGTIRSLSQTVYPLWVQFE